jgi:peptide/nickel transport system substrate-binding protein
MGVFNNLVVYDQNVKQNSLQSIVPAIGCKDVYIDGELDPVEIATWFPMIARKDYQIGL